jgi:phage-related protein
VIKPDAVRGAQPFIICYTGGTRPLYASFRYDDGMQINAYTAGVNYVEKPTIGLLAVDPFWYEDDQQQVTLDFTDSLSADYAFARIDGNWQQLGSGFNDDVYSITVDKQRNRIFFGGLFTTANGVTVNGICYWDGTTFQPLGDATKGVAGGSVYSIAIAPNGDIWAGGSFTSAGGSATKSLAKWDVSGTNAPTVYNTATTMSSINTISIDKNYVVYIGGKFTVFMGTANANHICYSSNQGTTWIALTATPPASADPDVLASKIGSDGVSLYFGGLFTSVGGVSGTAYIAKYLSGTITALSTGRSGGVLSLEVTSDGTLYVGSLGDNFSSWNGSAWLAIGEANPPYYMAANKKSGAIYYIIFANAPLRSYVGKTVSDSDFLLADIVILQHTQLAFDANDNLYLCSGRSAATAATTSGQTSITNSSTSLAYPLITITGTTTAAATSTLTWLENQTTKQRMYFNLTIQAGETITIDLSPLKKTVTSNWRGVIYDQPLSNSDFANWLLLPGANTIAAFITGTTTGVNMLMRWRPVHWGVDGTS